MKKFLLYFFGICCIFSSIYVVAQYGIFNGIVCIIIGIVLISLARHTDADNTPVDTVSHNDEQPQKTKTITFDVAGVSFSNETGRIRSRQTLLKKIYYSDPPFDLEYIVRLERYLYNNEPAYYVYVNDYIVGNVPKEFIPYFEKNIGRPYIVEYFNVHGGGEGKYYGAEVKIRYTDLEVAHDKEEVSN